MRDGRAAVPLFVTPKLTGCLLYMVCILLLRTGTGDHKCAVVQESVPGTAALVTVGKYAFKGNGQPGLEFPSIRLIVVHAATGDEDRTIRAAKHTNEEVVVGGDIIQDDVPVRVYIQAGTVVVMVEAVHAGESDAAVTCAFT